MKKIRVSKLVLWLFTVGIIVLLLSNLWVVKSTNKQIYKDVSKLPSNNVALVLGTSNRLTDGTPNPYFKLRIERAAELYKAGKVKHILVSGDNSSKYYNEPQKMKEALIQKGVDVEDITLDYAGLRTLDSVVRGKLIFGQERFTIITQTFHAHRALFISNYYNIDAVAMATDQLPDDTSASVKVREVFARPLAIWDLYIAKKEPKYLGKKENVNIRL